jgi:energy-coupling factor transport system permease protein
MHITAWLLWIAGILAAALSTRNPLYLLVLLLLAQTVSGRFAQLRGRAAPVWLWRFSLFVIPVSAAFNALTVHIGDTVLFVIPGSIPLLSGPVTLEALAYGAINGLVVVTMISIFSVISSAIPSSELVRATPRAFQSLGITAGIALNFIPQTARRLRDVREAQAVRGHQVKGLRDWLPLWLPLLMGGLEQSMQLSEAMVARGFGAAHGRASPLRTRGLLFAGLALILAGWLLRFSAAPEPVALGAMLAGGGAIVAGLWLANRAVPHTTYRERPFTRWDALASAASLLAGVVFAVALPFINRATLYYTPYPQLSPPGFEPLLGAAMLGWLAPLLSPAPETDSGEAGQRNTTAASPPETSGR